MSLLNALTKRSRLNAAVKTVAQARKSEGGRQEQLFLKAYDEFQDVIANDLILAESLYNWGFALLQQAKTKAGEAAIKLYEEASNKFSFCLTIDPNYLGAAIDGGVALMELARIKAVAINDPLYSGAREHFERAEKIHKGSAVYNLACIHALMGDDDACLAALQDSLKFGSLPNEAEVLQDPDLDKVKTKTWFTDFIASVAEKNTPTASPAPTPAVVEETASATATTEPEVAETAAAEDVDAAEAKPEA